MHKLNSIIDFSIILNRGYSINEDCIHFKTLKHPQLINLFISYIVESANLIGLTNIENRQSIADSGCDVFVEIKGNTKIGVQIKSENDIADENFSNKVKAQFAESFALGLDKYYILICSSMSASNERKVNYILSNMATYKTNYHVIINPNNCLNLFKTPKILTETEFDNQKRLYSTFEDKTELKNIIQLLNKEIHNSKEQSIEKEQKIGVSLTTVPFEPLVSAENFADYLGISDSKDIGKVLNDLNQYLLIISKLGRETRDFYFLLLNQSEDDELYIDGISVNLNEIKSLTSLSRRSIFDQIEILSLKKNSLVGYDADEPNSLRINYWGIDDNNIARDVKGFCKENNIDITEILQVDIF
jgi:hypothetical protein